jgi:thymidylate synthase (FAD)
MACLRVVQPKGEIKTPAPWFVGIPEFIEEAGRISHKSEEGMGKRPADDFVRRIAFKLGHESIIEHVSVSVLITGSRSMSHQLVRHRLAAYTQESQRYVDYSKTKFDNTLNVIVPPSIGTFPDGTIVKHSGLRVKARCEKADGAWEEEEQLHTNPWRLTICNGQGGVPVYTDVDGGRSLVFFHSLLTAYDAYLSLRKDHKVPSEDAREVLPNACKTEVITTYNLRQWRHVFSLRCTKHAQWQIRSIMQSILRLFLSNPNLRVFFEDQEKLLEHT